MTNTFTQNKRIRFAKGINCGWFYDDVYQINLHIVWPIGGGVLKRYIGEVFKMDYREDDNADGRCCFLENKTGNAIAIVIGLKGWTGSAVEYSILSHECFHATEFIFEDRGITHSDSSSEAWAYYQQYLFRQFSKILNGR